MCTNWKRWCRLCGLTADNEMQLDISAKLIELARRHLLIKTVSTKVKIIAPVCLLYFLRLQLSSTNEWPMLACHGCVEFLLELERFADRCRLIDKMFEELSTGQNKDILDVRNNYVLDFGKREVSTTWFNTCYLCHSILLKYFYRNIRKKQTRNA